jgi:hypothetical protein
MRTDKIILFNTKIFCETWLFGICNKIENVFEENRISVHEKCIKVVIKTTWYETISKIIFILNGKNCFMVWWFTRRFDVKWFSLFYVHCAYINRRIMKSFDIKKTYRLQSEEHFKNLKILLTV